MFTRIITSSLLFLIAIGGFVVSYDIGSIQVSQSYATIDQDNTDRGDTPATTAAAAKESNLITDGLNKLVGLLNTIFLALTMIVSPAIMLASWLMSPDWTSGDIFQLRDKMHEIWIIISNIVYFVYAILLILIALGTIFGKDSFSYKKLLPRLALGILMVPFTWWFVQWTISISAYMTASVMTIPRDIITKDERENSIWTRKNIPKDFYLTDFKDTKTPKIKCAGGTGCTSVTDFLKDGSGMYGSLLVYAYAVFKVDDIQELPFSESNPLKSIGQIANQMLIGVVMYIIFGFLVLALVSMLLIRVIKLWMYAIFSPLFTLHFVAGKELLGDKMGDFNIKEFIGLCFVPAIVGLSLSFGLIVIGAIQTPGTNTNVNGSSPNKCTAEILKTPEGCIMKSLVTTTKRLVKDGANWKTEETMELAGIKLHYTGKAVTNADAEAANSNDATIGYSILSSGGGILGSIIVDIIAIVFIWGAFMGAKGVSKAVAAAIDPFEKMGKSIGGIATSLPKYVPIPGSGGMSINSISKVPDTISSNIHAADAKRFEGSSLGKILGADKNIPGKSDETGVAAIDSNDIKRIVTQLKDMGSLGYLGRQNAYNAKTVDAMYKFSQDKDNREKLGAEGRWSQDDIKKFKEISEKPKNDQTMKEMVIFMNSKFGTSSSSTPPGGTGNTAASGANSGSPKDGKGNLWLGGVKINYTEIKDLKQWDQVANEIAQQIRQNAQIMTKPTEVEIKTELNLMGMGGEEINKATPKILAEIDKEAKAKWKSTP